MRYLKSKRYLIVLISSSLIAIAGIVYACAGGDDFGDFINSFFSPETASTKELKPYNRSAQLFYGGWGYDNEGSKNEERLMDSVNLDEWKAYFNNKVGVEDLRTLIYKSRLTEVDSCLVFLAQKQIYISANLKNNSLLKIEDKDQLKEFLTYISYAKQCEYYTAYEPIGWDYTHENEKHKSPKLEEELIKDGKKAFIKCKSAFMKERYAFQLMRMYYHAGLENDCIEFYQKNIELFKPNSSIAFRAMGYKAACEYRLGNFAKANYLYAQLFDQCNYMRRSSYLSFHPQEEEDWNEALALATTTHEKEALWQLFGIYADPLRAMKEIYKLNSRSSMMDILLVRAININEESFLTFNGARDPYTNELEANRNDSSFTWNKNLVDEDLLMFVRELTHDHAINKPYLWNLAAGYLTLAVGNYDESEDYFSKVVSKNQLVIDQVRALRLIKTIEQYKKPSSATEDELAKELIWIGKENPHQDLRANSIYSWAKSRLSVKYLLWGYPVFSQCLDNDANRSYYMNDKNMESMLALMDKPDKSNFEKCLLGILPYNKMTLFNYKAINLLYQYKFQEALAMMSAFPYPSYNNLMADPFTIHIKDCHDCDFEAKDKQVYTLYTFIQRMLELENKIKTDPKNAANYYFLMANGMYNMTYFGNGRDINATEIQSEDFFIASDHGNKPINSTAMAYYIKAMNASSNKEFKAKCCFMASKCEQNQYYESVETNGVQSHKYFDLLRDNFSKTKYYQEVIDECGYFATYIGKNRK